MKRALISVSDKTGIVDFAQGLTKLGYQIVSTGGTAKHLREGGIEVVDVSQITGFPECFEGRVKTLHPKIHGGILYRSDKPDHLAKAAELGIDRIDMVVVDLYPFRKTVAKPNVAFDDAIENIDIGGPTMIRAAAKNFHDVIVICDPADREPVLSELKKFGEVTEKGRLALAKKVFATMADYDGAIDQYLGTQIGKITEHLALKDGRELAYGENKCQNPAFIFSGGSDNPLAMTRFKVLAGNPSYIAMADASQLVDILCLMAEAFRRSMGKAPYIAIAGKHGNPAGAAISWEDPAVTIKDALMGDHVAVMGGELITNFPITDELGWLAHSTSEYRDVIGREHWGLDEILAPAISDETIETMGRKAKRRLLVNLALIQAPFPQEAWTYRRLHGGDWLKQRLSPFVLSPPEIQSWTGRPLEGENLANLIIAFACSWRASSNTVALAKDLKLIGLGCGQQDRRACVRLCLDRASRAGHNTRGSVFASDAFFPYASAPCESKALVGVMSVFNILRDRLKQTDNNKERVIILAELASLIDRNDRREGPELLADAGCIGGIVPADGKELPQVKKFFNDAEMRVAFVAPENRGFAKH